MYAEKAQLQNGADATALAIAGDCANGISCPTAMADPDNRLADANANDASSGVFSVTQPTTSSVRVETNAQASGSTDDSFALYFARILGQESSVIHATAVASWGSPSAATTLPWTISQCVFEKYLSPAQLAELNSTGSFTGDPIPTHILLRYDENTPDYPGCVPQNGYAEGGFGWLDRDTGCSADIDIAEAEVGNDPATTFRANARASLPRFWMNRSSFRSSVPQLVLDSTQPTHWQASSHFKSPDTNSAAVLR
ncbi:hypothetical protein [Arthrobacter nitrophenolicus]|uniref:hypothetical protein n=1 Tax=Arthrobacter nitrophenolicus TaxID=683150 RepID=UPI001F273F7F|nr:hypothetical protein [Arthrobacter nitrophenolicus]